METSAPAPTETAAAAIFRRILVPVDLRARSQRALQVALELRRRFDARICVLHVVRSDENDHFLAGIGSPITRSELLEEGNAEVRQFVRGIAPEDAAGRIESEAVFERDYVTAVRAKADDWEPTLVVLSPDTHPSLLRTHAEKLVKSLDVPVLVLEPPAREA
jgi:nucleotide-binding universal stress UspA family protein